MKTISEPKPEKLLLACFLSQLQHPTPNPLYYDLGKDIKVVLNIMEQVGTFMERAKGLLVFS